MPPKPSTFNNFAPPSAVSRQPQQQPGAQPQPQPGGPPLPTAVGVPAEHAATGAWFRSFLPPGRAQPPLQPLLPLQPQPPLWPAETQLPPLQPAQTQPLVSPFQAAAVQAAAPPLGPDRAASAFEIENPPGAVAPGGPEAGGEGVEAPWYTDAEAARIAAEAVAVRQQSRHEPAGFKAHRPEPVVLFHEEGGGDGGGGGGGGEGGGGDEGGAGGGKVTEVGSAGGEPTSHHQKKPPKRRNVAEHDKRYAPPGAVLKVSDPGAPSTPPSSWRACMYIAPSGETGPRASSGRAG
jgi:hypothetical protein